MNKKIIEDDNFLSQEEQENFLYKMLGDQSSSQIPKWRATNIFPILSWNRDNDKIIFKESPLIMTSAKSKPYLQFLGDLEFEDYKEIFDKFCKKHNIKYDKIIRARLVLTGKDDNDFFHLPHVDTVIKHDVFLYYLHDVDGDTVFFDKFLGDNLENPKIVKKISPKMGKAIKFNGHQFHSSFSTKESEFRCVLNVCYTNKVKD